MVIPHAERPVGEARSERPARRRARSWRFLVVVVVCVLAAAASAQEGLADNTRRRAFDQLLDLNVRNGDVYYRALKADRGKLDAFVNLNATTAVDKLSKAEQLAFWLNAYNALVLATVIDHYPVQGGRSADYPAKSIRQVSGAFERLPHRVSGRSLTLDQIEQTVLSGFNDPRVYFAIGRGATGSGRLRSEAFTGPRLEEQLSEVAAECVTRAQCVRVDREADQIQASSIFSWRSKDFIAAYADKAPAAFANRSPIERAIVAYIYPQLLPSEKEMLAKNTFKLVYTPFDWTLNDLTGRGGR
jgi:hypothetical protein